MVTFNSVDKLSNTGPCSAAAHLSLTHVNSCQILKNTRLQIARTYCKTAVDVRAACNGSETLKGHYVVCGEEIQTHIYDINEVIIQTQIFFFFISA